MSKLFKRKIFIIFSQIAYNRYSILIYILANFRANRLIFINMQLAIDVAKFLKIYIIKLPLIYYIKEFNKKKKILITYVILLYL